MKFFLPALLISAVSALVQVEQAEQAEQAELGELAELAEQAEDRCRKRRCCQRGCDRLVVSANEFVIFPISRSFNRASEICNSFGMALAHVTTANAPTIIGALTPIFFRGLWIRSFDQQMPRRNDRCLAISADRVFARNCCERRGFICETFNAALPAGTFAVRIESLILFKDMEDDGEMEGMSNGNSMMSNENELQQHEAESNEASMMMEGMNKLQLQKAKGKKEVQIKSKEASIVENMNEQQEAKGEREAQSESSEASMMKGKMN